MVWGKCCEPATHPKGPDRRPGERVGGGGLIETIFKPPVAQRAGGMCVFIHVNIAEEQSAPEEFSVQGVT